MFRVIALDPGGRTGWATYTATTRVLPITQLPQGFTSGTLGPEPHGPKIQHLLENQHVDDYHVVCERFIPQPDNPARNDISLQYQGVATTFCEERGLQINLQTPSQAKKFVPNLVLRKMGLWVPGEIYKHEMDANRHLLWFMVNVLMYKELLKIGWK